MTLITKAVIAGVAIFACFPMLREGTSTPCAALVSRVTIDTYGRDNQLLGIVGRAIGEPIVISAMQRNYPSPFGPQVSCLGIYWQDMIDPPPGYGKPPTAEQTSKALSQLLGKDGQP